jgi:hypothetical protein
VAQSAGLISDLSVERMVGARGPVTIDIRTEQRDADFWLVAKLAYPCLGLDLHVAHFKWTDFLAPNVVKSGLSAADERFAAHAREPAQARAVVTPGLMTTLLPFEAIKVEDEVATLASRGTPHATEPVQAFVLAVMNAADAITLAAQRVPPPILFECDLVAWRAFADRLRGRLELGRMHVHDGVIGLDRVSVGTEWTRSGALVGTQIRVVVDPALAESPTSHEDATLSAAARAVWRDLIARDHPVRIERDAVLVNMEGKLADPATAMPILELAVALRRALAGIQGAGPFR